jgi:protein-tyrosine phosphatase
MMDCKQILFLCTGNYYRSRYAEDFFNFYPRSEGLAWRAFSRRLDKRDSPDNLDSMSRFALRGEGNRTAGAGTLPDDAFSGRFR